MTNLDKDLAMMEKLGYGPHYGAYKADYPHTMEKQPDEILHDHNFRPCRNCGAMMRLDRGRRKLYCDDFCRRQYESKMAYEKTQERRNRNG